MKMGPLSHMPTAPAPVGASATDTVLAGLLAISLVQAVYYLLLSIERPLLDFYAFRQTQTALSAYWLLQGGPWLAYETPVLGAPWSLPFEFPTFQLIAAGFARLGLPLEPAGRLVSFGFFVAVLVPLRILLRDLGYDRAAYLSASVLYIACPLLVFWGRAFMIESCALFFGVLWLSLLVRFVLRRRGVGLFAATQAAGCLSALTKSTTFAGFGAVAGTVFVIATIDVFRKRELRAAWRFLILALSLCLIPLNVGLCWVAYTDWIKLANPFAASLTSDNLREFNYGTLEQRLGAAFWWDFVATRLGLNIFGYTLMLMPAIIVASLFLYRFDYRILIGVAAFFVPLLLFTNLYIIHDYYSSANAIFLLTAAGLATSAIQAAGWRLTAVAVLACVVIGDVAYLAHNYRPYLTQTNPLRIAHHGIALVAKQSVPASDGLLIFGERWSSVIPYYSERRSLTVFRDATPNLLDAVASAPQQFFGGIGVGAVIVCGDLSDYPLEYRRAAARLSEGLTAIGEVSPCTLYRFQPS